MKTLGKKYTDFWRIEVEAFQTQTISMIVFTEIGKQSLIFFTWANSNTTKITTPY